MRKVTTEDFIKKARKIHGGKYDYSKVEYVKSSQKVCIICPVHGEFWQRPNDHLAGKGCAKCANNSLKTTDSFIQELKGLYGDRYDYSKVDYKGAFNHVCIICHELDEFGEEHGEFLVMPTNLLAGKGCAKCANRYVPTTEEWIRRAKAVHGDKYDYSKVDYTNNFREVCIICHELDEFGEEHGEFWQSPYSHLQGGCGCSKCAKLYVPTTEEWIRRAKAVHGDKYDYSKVEYDDVKTKVCIICPVHGKFWQIPSSHLLGKGCAACAGVLRKERDEFIREATALHEGKYTYENCNYVNDKTKVEITCPIHGAFRQSPNSHLRGAGCPECYYSDRHLSETKVLKKLRELYPNVEYQKRFDWLGLQSLDFYLPDYKVGIEYQGRQHFSEDTYFYKNERGIIMERDERKLRLCEEHGIKLLHLTFEESYIPKDFNLCPLYTSLNDILLEISRLTK